MVRLAIDSIMVGDGRIKSLAHFCNENYLTTRGRLIGVWHICYEKRSEILDNDQINNNAEWYGEIDFGDFSGFDLVRYFPSRL